MLLCLICFFQCLLRIWLRLLRLFRFRCYRKSSKVSLKQTPVAFYCKAKKPDWVVRETIRLKAHLPKSGCRSVAHVFNRIYVNHPKRPMSISKSWVAHVLRNHHLDIAITRRKIRTSSPHQYAINSVWGIDLTGKVTICGKSLSMIGLIDHGSRRLLSLRVTRKCSLALLWQTLLCVLRFGKPKAIRSDNERCWTSRSFSSAIRLLGIRHQRTELHCPWQNGRIERCFGTLKSFLDQVVVNDAAHLQMLLNQFQLWYNEIRPHQALHGATPLEAWRGINPYQKRWKSAHWFNPNFPLETNSNDNQ